MGDVEANTLKTLIEILDKSSFSDTKIQTLDFLLGLTGSSNGMSTIYENANLILPAVIKSSLDENLDVSLRACSVLINISAEKRGVDLLLSTTSNCSNVNNSFCKIDQRQGIISALLEITLCKNNAATDCACIILSNLSRSVDSARKIYETLENPDAILSLVISRAVRMDIKVDHLVSFLSNLSQLNEVRTFFLNSSHNAMDKLLSLIDFRDSLVRRKGAIGVIRNLSFYNDNHDTLLDTDDLLAKLLMPLAGPEEFDDEDNEKLPLDLQYLPSDKIREPNLEIRKMLVEIFIQLAATASGRKTMRERNVYVIFREYHKWENDKECLQLIEDFVNILIRTEEEIGVDNLRDCEVIDRSSDCNSHPSVFI